MLGLINCAVQNFIRTTYGDEVWCNIADTAGLDFQYFEPMLTYDAALVQQVTDTACQQLGKTRADFLGDVGTYLVSAPETGAIRRLLRFGGSRFDEFLHSLEELSDRVRLVIHDVNLPSVRVERASDDQFRLTVGPGLAGYASVLVGMLRAMGDDYGALVLTEESAGQGADTRRIDLSLISTGFAEARAFALAGESA